MLMVMCMKENGVVINLVDMVSIIILMVQHHIKVNGILIINTEKELKLGQMVHPILVNIIMVRDKGKEYSNLKMALCNFNIPIKGMKENSIKMRLMDMVNTNGQMGENIMG